MTRIFSGIQPTGRKHLGNYIGAITQYVAGQERGDGLFCIVDLHATTVAYDPARLRDSVLDAGATLLAAGLDPSRCIFFRQSDVREHTELQDTSGQRVGEVTSGLLGPSIDKPIAMGYVQQQHAAIGTRMNAIVRGKPVAMEVTAMPFVPSRYHRG